MTRIEELEERITSLTAEGAEPDGEEARAAVDRLLAALSEGEVRAAEKAEGGWRAVEWVKAGILLAFQVGRTRSFGGDPQEFFDRDTLPLRRTRGVEENIRIVPGGSSVRKGAYLGPDVVMMPPAYVNVGAWVDEGTMVDSHALVGSCAQVGRRVHLSAGCQLGGVLEPRGARPVVIEDEVLMGGNTGVFEGIVVGRRAVIAPGVNLTSATALYDLVNERVLRHSADDPLTVPEGAVVVPGVRDTGSDFAREHGVALYTPVIVKYRDEKTDAATALEGALR